MVWDTLDCLALLAAVDQPRRFHCGMDVPATAVVARRWIHPLRIVQRHTEKICGFCIGYGYSFRLIPRTAGVVRWTKCLILDQQPRPERCLSVLQIRSEAVEVAVLRCSRAIHGETLT